MTKEEYIVFKKMGLTPSMISSSILSNLRIEIETGINFSNISCEENHGKEIFKRGDIVWDVKERTCGVVIDEPGHINYFRKTSYGSQDFRHADSKDLRKVINPTSEIKALAQAIMLKKFHAWLPVQ